MIRPDYVTLLADVQIDITAPASTWQHNDGRALTGEEVDQVLNATIEEACAVIRYAQLVIEQQECLAADIARAEELAAPYVAQLGPGADVAGVLAVMPVGPEREEFAQLAERIAFATEGTAAAG